MSGKINVMFDVETDGRLQGVNSMISIGAVVMEEGFNKTYYEEIKPIGTEYDPNTLAISEFSREDTMSFKPAEKAMKEFEQWCMILVL